MNKKRMGFLVVLAMVLCMGMSLTVMAAQNGWVKNGKNTYYYSEGKKNTGWQTINGKQYFFKNNGIMVSGRHKIAGKVYQFKSNGILVKELSGAKWVKDAKGKRYYNGDGTYLKGWKTVQGKRYYFGKKRYASVGWKQIKEKWYYFDTKGVLVTKKRIKTNGSTYYVDKDGVRVISKWVGKRYYGADGRWIKSYVDETRKSETKSGWVGYGRYWRYYINGSMVSGWKTIQGNRYFFESTGYAKIGWYNDGTFYYFLSTDVNHIGVMTTGWKNIDGKYYYFFPKKTRVGGTIYKKGAMARGVRLKASSTGYIYDFNNRGECVNYK